MRVLVAEDDPVNLRVLEAALGKWGHEPVLARDGDEAWRALQRDDAPQLAILDWMMPGLDGVEICRKARAMPSPRLTHILLLTSKDRREDIIAGLDAGADDYVVKPFDPAELQARVQVGVRMLELQRSLADREKELAVARVTALEQQRLEAAVSAMSDGIVVTDARWRITTANRAACLLLNIPADGPKDIPLTDVLRPFTLSTPIAQLESSPDRVTALEIARPHTQPPLFLDARLARVFDSAGALASTVLTVRDVTDDRRARHVQANFFTAVTHKLATPLNVVGGWLQLCRRMPPDRLLERLDSVLSVCDTEIRRLTGVVRGLLDFKALSTQQLEAEAEPTAIAPVVAAVADEIALRYPDRQIAVAPQLAPAATHVAASAEHLALVLEKLLDNAAKFADKGPVRIAIRVEPQAPTWVRFSVADNGPGIPHEYYDRLFEGFVQVEDHVTGQVPGLGIGLYLARQVVRAYGGTITLQSRIGEGTTVTFTLPGSGPAATPP